jgi:hypothetical protein
MKILYTYSFFIATIFFESVEMPKEQRMDVIKIELEVFRCFIKQKRM